MQTIILGTCEKELASLSREVIEDLLDIILLLNGGLTLSMPLSRVMPSIGKNIHELRLKDKSGAYRVFYIIKKKGKETIMKLKRYKRTTDLAMALGLPPGRGAMAEMKARLIKEMIKTIKGKGLTHQDVSDLSGVPRSAITGIVNGSLQKVSIERLIRIVTALGKAIELKIKSVA